MKVAAILAVAGAIVGEFLGSDRGLGYLMLQVQVTLDTAAMFMAVILITLIGMVLYGLVLGLERMLVVRDARLSRRMSSSHGRTVHPSGRRHRRSIAPAARISSPSPRRRSTSRRASSCRWSAPRAAARPRCSRSWPACIRTTPARCRSARKAQPFDPSRDIGMVFQQPLLLKWRRIIDNVLLPAEILGLADGAEPRARARDLLALVGLKGAEDKYPYELSGGMQQRAAIARALVHDPKLILMDEPFGALDALTREKMNLELLRIWEEARKTIIFVTHGITEAVFLGTRVIVLTAGPARMADNFRVELPHPRTLDMKTSENSANTPGASIGYWVWNSTAQEARAASASL